jgi:hypothetical protein
MLHALRLGHHRGDGTQLQRLVDKVVSIEALALECDEQIAVHHLPAVGGHPVEARPRAAASGADLVGSGVDVEHRVSSVGRVRRAPLPRR